MLKLHIKKFSFNLLIVLKLRDLMKMCFSKNLLLNQKSIPIKKV